MSSSKYNAAAKASALAQKSANLTYKETKTPDNSVDFSTSFKAATSAKVKMANTFTVDVFPDFVPILMFILFHVVQLSSSLDDRAHAKVTTPTFVMYCLTLVYGYFLLSDMYVRPNSSEYAQDYFNVATKKQLADLLLTLPVPKFLEPLLKHFTCTTAPHSGNIVFCPSAAGFTHDTHFGRFFPINIFTKIHDFTAELNPRSSPARVSASLFSQVIYQSSTFVVCIGNFFGALRSDTYRHTDNAHRAYDSYSSVLRQAFDSAFNPVLSRDYTRRSTLAPLNIATPNFASNRMNPYDLLFAFTPANFNELRIVLTSVASVMNGAIPISGDLASMFATPSGKTILIHGYSTFALPTWHAVQIHADVQNGQVDDITVNPNETRQQPEEAAASMHFLIEPSQDAATHTNAFTPFSATCQTTPAHPVTVVPMTAALNLLSANDVADPPVRNPASTEFITFDEDRDAAPLVLVLEPTEDSEENAWTATCFGKVIQSFEIDASAVPHPNPEATLATENAKFAESAIPRHSVVYGTRFNNTDQHFARRRAVERRNLWKAATILFDFSKLYVPRPLRHTIDNLVGNGLPGLTYNDDVNWIARTAQYFGIRLISNGNAAAADRHAPHIAAGTIYIWSPYTYTPVAPTFNNTNARLGYTAATPQTYFISNLRTLFGTDPQLIEAQHAFKAFPIA